MSFFSEDYLLFFQELAANNHKDWFDANRKRYERSVKEPFKLFTQHLIDELAKKEPVFKDLKASDCIFRINRDIRFSKDKTPYKKHLSGGLTRATKRLRGGYYFHIEPGNSFVAGGFWAPNSPDLKRIREEIAIDDKPLRKIIKSASFKKMVRDL